MKIQTTHSLLNITENLKELMDICFPKPPKNVFYLTIENYKVGDTIHFITDDDDNKKIIAFVYAVKNSKGVTLENLSVHPNYRGKQISTQLLKHFIDSHKGIVTITTRIPDYFEKFGFNLINQLPDKSFFMYLFNFQ